MSAAPTELTLGPNLFNWAPESWRDFYFRIADEAPVSIVYLGETICSKRAPLFDELLRGGQRTPRRGRQDRGAFDAGRDRFEDRSAAGQRRLRKNGRSGRGERRVGGVPSARAAALHRPADERLQRGDPALSREQGRMQYLPPDRTAVFGNPRALHGCGRAERDDRGSGLRPPVAGACRRGAIMPAPTAGPRIPAALSARTIRTGWCLRRSSGSRFSSPTACRPCPTNI